MKKMKRILNVLLVSLMFLFPVVLKAEESDPVPDQVSINGQNTYATLADALTAAHSGDEIVLIQNVTIDTDTTIPAGITLKNTTNTLTVNTGVKLTVAGKILSSANSKVIIEGTLELPSGGVAQVDATYDVKGTIHMEGNSKIEVNSILNLITNSKIVTNGVEGPVVNLYKTGSIIGSASALSTAHKVKFNNYAGRMGESLVATVTDGFYTYYPIYDTTNNRWYQTFDELNAGDSVSVVAPITINGDATIKEGVQISAEAGYTVTVNGTFTIDGTYDMESGYSQIVASNLYGSGTVVLNSATEMATSWWTYVTILHDVSNTLKFEAMPGYNPAKDDILFELGSNTDEAVAIAAKIKLGSTFGDKFSVTPKQTNLNYQNGGTLLGVLGDKVNENSVDTTPPNTGNGDLFILGLISLSAIFCAAFCARRIYILNRI